MKISPELYKVKIQSMSEGWDIDEEKFLKEQTKFHGIDFVQLSAHNSDASYNQNLLIDDDMVLSKDQIMMLVVKNVKFEVTQTIDCQIDITQQLIELAEKPIQITAGSGTTYNNKCEVHLPGNMLAMYNEMMILTDSCTDDLQSNLNGGWRIVAACPQPDQRRPDYVLGRFNPNKEIDGSAER